MKKLFILAVGLLFGLASCDKTNLSTHGSTQTVANGTGIQYPLSHFLTYTVDTVPSREIFTQIKDSVVYLSENEQLSIWESKLNFLLQFPLDDQIKSKINELLDSLNATYFISDSFEINQTQSNFIQSWEASMMNLVSPTDYLIMFFTPIHINPIAYHFDWPAGLPNPDPDRDCECAPKSDYCDPWWVDTNQHCSTVDCLPPLGGCGTLYLFKCRGICVLN